MGGLAVLPAICSEADAFVAASLREFCAGDAEALQVVVRGDPTPRARDQWLEVEGTWAPRPVAADDGRTPPPPVLNVDAVRPVGQPRPPYEYTVQFNG